MRQRDGNEILLGKGRGGVEMICRPRVQRVGIDWDGTMG